MDWMSGTKKKSASSGSSVRCGERSMRRSSATSAAYAGSMPPIHQQPAEGS